MLTAWLLLPMGALVALMWGIAGMMTTPKKPFGPPVGAGAGYTGGANAIGNLLAGKPANTDAMPPRPEAQAADGSRGVELGGGSVPAASEPTMVQPESLTQGFILVVEDRARIATQSSPIYIASNLYSNWNPGDPKFMLSPQSDMRWRIELPQPEAWKGGSGPALAFKFTRGTWELEELNDDLTSPGNRTLPKIDASRLAPGEKPVIEVSVAKWGDMRTGFVSDPANKPFEPLTVSGDVRRLKVVDGAAGGAGMTRECLVWLPPGYDDPANAARRYPVLYMHDGQNLFAKHAGVPAEWGLDETAGAMIRSGAIPPVVIVGIPHAGATRIREYLPVNAYPPAGVPAGPDHVAWLMREVKPRVERAFRVETDRAKVGIGGSSLGAAVALYAALEHPDAFGLVYAESLPLNTGDSLAWQGWLNEKVKPGARLPDRVYLGMGGKESGIEPMKRRTNEGYVKLARDLSAKLTEASGGETLAVLVVDEDATHTESAWASRAGTALTVLFGDASAFTVP